MNPLQRKHADLGRRAAWGGKTTNLAAWRQDPVAGDDQRHRILRHGLANIARGFRSGAELLRQSAISGRATPFDLSRSGINTLEERGLLTEVELEPGKIRLLALKIALTAATASTTSGVGAPGLAPGARRSNIRWAPSPLFAGNWKRVMPKLFQAMPQKPLPVSKIKKWCAAWPIVWPSYFDLSWNS
jgi:hypothetical protein